ncbi:GDSL-type esterase/lipase family protein [Ideonella sp. DXS29W]|uniref:GDSL-type esterase/lipase family protein n=1 Tax=Ideonella lacteola TaxID=2984193 RepID=A0ABU9BXZ3_9BURK
MKVWMYPLSRWIAATALVLTGVASAATTEPASMGPADAAVRPDDPSIRWTGRIDRRRPLAPAFGWPGTAFRVRTDASRVVARLEDERGQNWVRIRVDGGSPRDLRLPRGVHDQVIADGLPPGVHEIELIKRTEGYFGAVRLHGLALSPKARLMAWPPATGPRLEFYGDSNSAGYSSQSIHDSGLPRDDDNDAAYPAITTRLLGGQYHCMCWSGATIAPGSGLPVQGFWDRVLPLDPSRRFDFSEYDADVVVINVGSNDSYDGDNRDGVMAGWHELITERIRPVHPHAHIVLADSYGWSFDEPANYLQDMVRRLAAEGDTNVSSLAWPWLWGQTHAVEEEHAGFANLLAAHIAQRLRWPTPPESPLSSLRGPGVLFNGGFDIRPSNPLRRFDASGWRVLTRGEAEVRMVDGAMPADRHAHLRTGGTASRPGMARLWQAMPNVDGAHFTLNAQVRGTPGRRAHVQLVFKDQGQKIISRSPGVVTLRQDWQAVQVRAKAPPGAWSVNVVVQASGRQLDVEVDDVNLDWR